MHSVALVKGYPLCPPRKHRHELDSYTINPLEHSSLPESSDPFLSIMLGKFYISTSSTMDLSYLSFKKTSQQYIRTGPLCNKFSLVWFCILGPNMQIPYWGVFFHTAEFRGNEERKRENWYKKVLSSWSPLHGIILETFWNASQDHLSWGKERETLIHQFHPLFVKSSPPGMNCLHFWVVSGLAWTGSCGVSLCAVNREARGWRARRAWHRTDTKHRQVAPARTGSESVQNWLSWQWLAWETSEAEEIWNGAWVISDRIPPILSFYMEPFIAFRIKP